MTILLLGGTGYLGSNLAKRLALEGYKVICTVRPTSDISKFKKLKVIENIKLISNDSWPIKLILQQENIDWVINCACIYKPNDSLYGDMLEANVVFPLTVINYALQYGVKNFMTVGTSLPSKFNAYSFTKSQLSAFGEFFAVSDTIRFIELRLEMFYGGENEPTGRFIKSCAEKLLHNEPLMLTEGTQKRDIVRVEDILDIIARLLRYGFKQGYEVLPIGSGESHSIREIITYMRDCLNSKSEINFGAVPSRVGEPNTVADIHWYTNIDFKLKYSYFDGLKDACSNIYGESVK